jgi:hypothetical protein
MRPRNKVEGELLALARERPSLSRGLGGSVTWPNSINCPSGSRMPRTLAIAALDHPLSWIGPMLRRTVNLSKDRPTRPLTGAIPRMSVVTDFESTSWPSDAVFTEQLPTSCVQDRQVHRDCHRLSVFRCEG